MFQPGDKVFAKVKGFSFWPARVDFLPAHIELPKGKIPVFFYGTHQVSFLSPKNLVNYEDYKELYGNRKTLIKAMIEIESDPEVLLLGKDPAAEEFWENLYPRGSVKTADTISRSRTQCSASPPVEKASKRKTSRTSRISAKGQTPGDQGRNRQIFGSTGYFDEAASAQNVKPKEKNEGIRQEEDFKHQPFENATEQTANKRRLEFDELIEGSKRTKEESGAREEKEENNVLLNEFIDYIQSTPCDSLNAANGILLHTADNYDREEVNDINVGQKELPVKEEGRGEFRRTEGTSEIGERRGCGEKKSKLSLSAVDLDSESEEEIRYYRKCSRIAEIEDLDDDDTDDYAGDPDYMGFRKSKSTHKRIGHRAAKGKTTKSTASKKEGGIACELTAEPQGIIDTQRMYDHVKEDEITVSKSTTGGSDDGSVSVQNDSNAPGSRGNSENGIVKLSLDCSAPVASNDGSGDGVNDEDEDEAARVADNRNFGSTVIEKRVSSSWRSDDDTRRLISSESLGKSNLDSVGAHQEEANREDDGVRSLKKSSPPNRAGMLERENAGKQLRKRNTSEGIEPMKKGRRKSLSAIDASPSRVDPLEVLRDFGIQLKSSLVQGHENFAAAVAILEHVCMISCSLLQLTQVWELTDCVKKCRKYRLSAEVRDAASRTLAHFQRIQAAASKDEVLKAKAVVAKRLQRDKSIKPSIPPAATTTPATTPSAPMSTTDSPAVNSSPEQPEKNKFSLAALRAELDAKADLLLARLAATEARLMADRNKSTTSPPAPSSLTTSKVEPVRLTPHKRTEEAADDVLSRVDEVASRLGADLDTAPPPPPPRFVRRQHQQQQLQQQQQQQVDLDTRINQLMRGVITPASQSPPQPQSTSPSSKPQAVAPAKLLALRDQIQRKRRSAAAAVANAAEGQQKVSAVAAKTADDDIYDLLGV